MSEVRGRVDWRRAGIALALTIALTATMLKVYRAQELFALLTRGVDAITAATRAGTSFVFGYVGGGPMPFDPKFPGPEFVLAFQALPLIRVVSVISALPEIGGRPILLERLLGVVMAPVPG